MCNLSTTLCWKVGSRGTIFVVNLVDSCVLLYGSVFDSFGPLSNVVDPHRVLILFRMTSLVIPVKMQWVEWKGVTVRRVVPFVIRTPLLYFYSWTETKSGVFIRTESFRVVIRAEVSVSEIRPWVSNSEVWVRSRFGLGCRSPRSDRLVWTRNPTGWQSGWGHRSPRLCQSCNLTGGIWVRGLGRVFVRRRRRYPRPDGALDSTGSDRVRSPDGIMVRPSEIGVPGRVSTQIPTGKVVVPSLVPDTEVRSGCLG